jgi:formate hydrogenlyase subunit 6/NADH:ubiquinone oxidoreductase subunit I
MKKPKIRELLEAIRALIKGPYTSRFPRQASPAAPRFRGKIEFDPATCILCGACVEVCPVKARAQVDDRRRRKRREIHYQERCVYCGQCVQYCTTKTGIRHTPVYDLAQTTKDGYENAVEGELILCERCGEPITTRAHLRWIARRVGELAYANPNLFLVLGQELGDGFAPPNSEPPPYRSEHLRFLCPACRRAVYLQELWGY